MITELVRMRIGEDIEDETFIAVVDEMERAFHMELEGYVDSELFKEADGLWRMLMHWESKEALKKASGSMMRSETTLGFRNCLIPGSVEISFFDQAGAWRSERRI